MNTAIENRKARFEYQIFESIEAGIVLLGGEVKSIRGRRATISESYAKIINSEVFLINANIPIEGKKDYDPNRTRKLLLSKDQIISISSKIKAKKLTLVPLKLYTKGRLIKVQLALAKSKRKFEKKQSLKEKDLEREIQSELTNKYQ